MFTGDPRNRLSEQDEARVRVQKTSEHQGGKTSRLQTEGLEEHGAAGSVKQSARVVRVVAGLSPGVDTRLAKSHNVTETQASVSFDVKVFMVSAIHHCDTAFILLYKMNF